VVGESVGNADFIPVVGASAGPNVGKAFKTFVGPTVGEAFGVFVGASVGPTVGSGAGAFVVAVEVG
jgi:hypothetical protein